MSDRKRSLVWLALVVETMLQVFALPSIPVNDGIRLRRVDEIIPFLGIETLVVEKSLDELSHFLGGHVLLPHRRSRDSSRSAECWPTMVVRGELRVARAAPGAVANVDVSLGTPRSYELVFSNKNAILLRRDVKAEIKLEYDQREK